MKRREGRPITILADREVRRYSLRFNSHEDYRSAEINLDAYGFISFTNGKGEHLIGKVVRKAPEELVLEVDAATERGLQE